MAPTPHLHPLSRHIDARFAQIIEQLSSLVAVPGIAWDAFDRTELDRSAEAVAQLAVDAGFSDVQLLSVDVAGVRGGPAVVARRPAAPGQPTVMLYAHHDVQPPGDAELWQSDPFTAVERDGRLYGRGAADDKAGILVHLSAVEAVLQICGADFGTGITLFIEGEEEAGSPTFEAFLQEHRNLLKADVIIVADSANWKAGVPALTTSLRGLVDGVVTVSVLEHAVHSGMFGGPLLDAPTLLARLIATFHDNNGSVAVEGLTAYDDGGPEYPEQDFRRDASVLDGVQLAGRGSLTSRLWTQPALSVIGIDAPTINLASNTLVPQASAKISLRLAPGQDPAAAMAALRHHIQVHAPFGAQVEFRPGESGSPFATDAADPVAQAALDALEAAWGVPAVQTGIGGSIPFIADLTRMYPDARILITGVEDPDTRAHSANESLHLADFKKAIVAEAELLARINEGIRESAGDPPG